MTHSINAQLTWLGRADPRQVGLARLVTDEVSFAYLTDVYILDEQQGRGLGKFLIKCIDETLSHWPELRRAILFTSTATRFYEQNLGMKAFESNKNGLAVMSRKGSGSVLPGP